MYVDDMLVKSFCAKDYLAHLAKMFDILHMYWIKLKPNKCAFGVSFGKFLRFMVNYRGIETNPDKIRVILEMEALWTIKKVQRLTGKVATLNRFVSKVTNKCLPFFKVLKKVFKFGWTPDYEEAFVQLKEYLG